MQTSSRIAGLGAAALLGVIILPHATPLAPAPFQFQYAAKVMCGRSDGNFPVIAQPYATSINVNNPSDSLTAQLRKWLVVTFPRGGQIPQPPRKEMRDTILNRWALNTDCRDMMRRNGLQLPFFEGFLVLQSDLSLDVVGVYTVPGGIDVVTIPERRVSVSR